MKWLTYILIPLLLVSTTVCARTKPKSEKLLKIIVIDTGLDLNDPRLKDQLCKSGHKDFSGEGLVDINGHGTAITGIIEEFAGKGNYCLMIYKYYSTGKSEHYNGVHEVNAIAAAVESGADIVNISTGGKGFIQREYDLIKRHPKTTFVVAAGNDGHNLDRDCNYFPACYLTKNEIRVANLQKDGQDLVPSSNYGLRAVSAYEIGDDVSVMLPGGYTTTGTGTSQATARHTGKLIRKILDAKHLSK